MILVTNISGGPGSGPPVDCWIDPHYVSRVQAHRDNEKGILECDSWWVYFAEVELTALLVNEADRDLILEAKEFAT